MIQDIYLIITAIAGLAAYVVKIQITASNNTKNQAEFKNEMNAKTDKLDTELNNKVDKLEKVMSDRMEIIQEQMRTTQLEVVEIKSDTKHIRESIHSLVQLVHQHVLGKDV